MLSLCPHVCLTNGQTFQYSGVWWCITGQVSWVPSDSFKALRPFMLSPSLGPSICSSLHVHCTAQQSSSHSTLLHFTPQHKQLYTISCTFTTYQSQQNTKTPARSFHYHPYWLTTHPVSLPPLLLTTILTKLYNILCTVNTQHTSNKTQ
jgi:hypothetical protein